MRVYNKSQRMYQHGEYKLSPGANLEVPKNVADLWLSTGEIVEYIDPKEAKAKEEKALKEKEALEKENADLKAKLAKLEKEAAAKKEKANK